MDGQLNEESEVTTAGISAQCSDRVMLLVEVWKDSTQDLRIFDYSLGSQRAGTVEKSVLNFGVWRVLTRFA